MNSQARTEWIWKLRAFPWFPLRLRMIFMPPGKQATTNGTTKTNTRKCNQKLRKHSMQINFSFNCSVSASSVGFPQRGARFTAEQGSNGREALMNTLVVCNLNRQLFEMSFIRWSIEQSSLAGFIWLKWVSMSEKFSINCQFTSRGCMAAATGLAVIKSVWFEPEILIQRRECSTHSIIWSDQRPASFVRQTREEKKFEKKNNLRPIEAEFRVCPTTLASDAFEDSRRFSLIETIKSCASSSQKFCLREFLLAYDLSPGETIILWWNFPGQKRLPILIAPSGRYRDVIDWFSLPLESHFTSSLRNEKLEHNGGTELKGRWQRAKSWF